MMPFQGSKPPFQGPKRPFREVFPRGRTLYDEDEIPSGIAGVLAVCG